MTYIEGLFIAFDQFINAALGGWPDETLSSRCWRWSRDGVRDWPRRFIDGLPFWKAAHDDYSIVQGFRLRLWLTVRPRARKRISGRMRGRKGRTIKK